MNMNMNINSNNQHQSIKKYIYNNYLPTYLTYILTYHRHI